MEKLLNRLKMLWALKEMAKAEEIVLHCSNPVYTGDYFVRALEFAGFSPKQSEIGLMNEKECGIDGIWFWKNDKGLRIMAFVGKDAIYIRRRIESERILEQCLPMAKETSVCVGGLDDSLQTVYLYCAVDGLELVPQKVVVRELSASGSDLLEAFPPGTKFYDALECAKEHLKRLS